MDAFVRHFDVMLVYLSCNFLSGAFSVYVGKYDQITRDCLVPRFFAWFTGFTTTTVIEPCRIAIGAHRRCGYTLNFAGLFFVCGRNRVARSSKSVQRRVCVEHDDAS